jgi:hypothetical protein
MNKLLKFYVIKFYPTIHCDNTIVIVGSQFPLLHNFKKQKIVILAGKKTNSLAQHATSYHPKFASKNHCAFKFKCNLKCKLIKIKKNKPTND